jgi:arginine-tRNA-protein transferase
MDPLHTLPRLLDRVPAEVLVHSEEEPCPYIEGQTALMPLRLPIRRLQPSELDDRLAAGDRRHGALLYRPTCKSCQACEAIRLDAPTFQLRPHHRRILRRGDRELRVELGPPLATEDRLALFERHKQLRGLETKNSRPMTLLSYQRFLVDRLCGSFELRYFHKDRLVGIAVTDRGAESLSAVYCFYDPSLSKLSIGTYSILKQLELAREWRMRHVYLGLYIKENEHMAYKSRFRPHERLVDGEWRLFPRPTD